MTKVLVVSNDSSLKKNVDVTLKYNGFIVHKSSDSTEAWKYLNEIHFDFIMLDMQLNCESGLSFYKALRQYGNNIPVLMVGEGDFDAFMLKDLAFENYDYILKPFKFRELRMKINTFLENNKVSEKIISYGDLNIDVRQQVIVVKNTLVHLGKMEMKILMLLAKKTGDFVHPKRIKLLLEAEGNFYNMTTFYYVSKLREKLKAYGGEALDIIMVKDLGYRLELKS